MVDIKYTEPLRGAEMTRYEELCQAHFAVEPRWAEIDTTVRKMPEKMRQAFSDHLEAPPGAATFPTIIAEGRSIPYVALYRVRFNQSGERSWEVCPRGEELQIDKDGIGHFTVGICLERQIGAIPASMMYMEFSIEAIDEHSAELQLVRTGDKVVIKFDAPAGYTDAAASVITRVMKGLKDPPPTRGLRGPIGF